MTDEAGDQAGLDAWSLKFEEWKGKAFPLMSEGKIEEAFGLYPDYTTDGEPFVRLGKPASEARFGLVTTGGYSIEGEQEPFAVLPAFDDTSPEIRIIPADVDRSKLRIDHKGYDHRFAKEDINVNLPFDRLRELDDAGEIGSFAPDTAVLMGLIPNAKPLIRDTIPALVEHFRSDDVEAVLLVPS